MKKIFLLLIIITTSAGIFAATKTWLPTTGGVWTTASNWSPSGQPVNGDDVFINSNQSANITAVPPITLNSLTVSGNCALAAAASGNLITISTTFSVSAGKTLTMGLASGTRLNFTLSSTATGTINGIVSMNPGAGTIRTFTNNGVLILAPAGILSGSVAFTLASGATLQIGSTAGIASSGATGNIQVTGTRTFNIGANYIYNGASSQSIGTGFPTGLTGILRINNPGNTVTLGNAKTIASGGSINLTAGTFAVGLNLTLASTSSINRSEGSMTGTLQGTGVYDVTYTGNFKTSGPELINGGLRNVTVNLTSDQTLTLNVNTTPDGNLNVTSGIFDLSTFTMNRSAAGGTLTMSNGATLKIGGTNTLPSNYTTHSIGATSTVEYAGAAQSVANLNSSQTYGNLTLGGSGTKTLQTGTTIITGNLTLSGTASVTTVIGLTINGNFTIGANSTFNASTFTHNLKSNWSNSGTFTPSTSTFNFNGTASQSLTGLTTFTNLTVNNPAGVTLLSPATVNGILNLPTSGNLTTTSALLTLGNAATVSGGSDNSFVNGPMAQTWTTTTASKTYPLGKGATYRPLVISLTTPVSPVIRAEVFNANAGGTSFYTISTVRYYQTALVSGSYTTGTVQITYGADDGVTDNSTLVVAQSATQSGAYTTLGRSGSTSSTVISASTNPAFGNNNYLLLGSTATNPLPVELTSFSASVVGSKIKLNWATATEVNNYGFEIERKILKQVQNDNTDWEKIGFVNGNGNSNSQKNYAYEDKNLSAGKYSYRLKQIDNDGQFEYSKTIEVDFGVPTKFELSQNYPNPFNPTTTIKFSLPEAKYVKLTIYNILGQEIKTLVNEFKEAGVHTINFNSDGIDSGVYIYRIEAGTFSQTRKMTLIK